MLEFAGPATRLVDRDIEYAAEGLGCELAAIRAVIDVESGGGFLRDGRPRILFERHYFARLTNQVHNARHPNVSLRQPGGYKGGAAEYDRLHDAIALDRNAALRSASWGMFQIMGDNCRRAGFPDVESFVAAMVSGEKAHLAAFVCFVRAAGLGDALADADWVRFAHGYNGPGYARNKYDLKLAAAFARHAAAAPARPRLPVLRIGARGEFVERLQKALGLAPDGVFGPVTRAAVASFQKRHGRHADGIVGPRTWSLLDS